MATSFYLEQLTDRQLHALTQYKYEGEDRSITYKYIMSPFYRWLINYIPLSIAPNTITFAGFLLTTAAHFLLMYHSPHLDEPAPRYVYTFAGLALFIYMILDNLDGKQARRTNTSSPLGQLFDHGCDAMNVTLSGMSSLAAIQLGANVLAMVVLFLNGHIILFGATLEEYHTGAMVLREVNGPNEGLLTLIVAQLITGILGPEIWTRAVIIPYTNGMIVELKYVMYCLAAPPTLNAIAGNIWGIAKWNRQNGKSVGRAVGELLMELWAIFVVGFVFITWSILAEDHFRRQGILIMWISGGVVFDLICRIMLAHLAKAPYPYMPGMLWVVIFCWANALLGVKGNEIVGVDETTYLVAFGCGLYNVWRSWCVVTQLCDFLNVGCFSVRRPREASKES